MQARASKVQGKVWSTLAGPSKQHRARQIRPRVYRSVHVVELLQTPGVLRERHIRAFPGAWQMLWRSHSCISHMKPVRRTIYTNARLRGGELLYSRAVDKTFRTTEDEEIVEKGRGKSAAARTNDRTPDPIVVTKCEHCQ
jgi:hypothetical protein